MCGWLFTFWQRFAKCSVFSDSSKSADAICPANPNEGEGPTGPGRCGAREVGSARLPPTPQFAVRLPTSPPQPCLQYSQTPADLTSHAPTRKHARTHARHDARTTPPPHTVALHSMTQPPTRTRGPEGRQQRTVTVAMSVVYELPPRDSCSSRVSLESLYGMYLHRSHARSDVREPAR